MRRLAALLGLCLAAGCATAPPAPVDGAPYLAALRGLSTVDGGSVDWAALQGRVVVVQFLASWCFPCVASASRLEQLQRQDGKAGLSVLAVGMDLEGARVLGPFVAQLGLSYPVLLASAELRDGRTAYGRVAVLPTTVVIGRDRRVVAAWVGILEEGAVDPVLAAALAR